MADYIEVLEALLRLHYFLVFFHKHFILWGNIELFVKDFVGKLLPDTSTQRCVELIVDHIGGPTYAEPLDKKNLARRKDFEKIAFKL